MLLAHLAVTWTLVGLIWVIQIVVYPQLRAIEKSGFIAYHFAHCLRIGLLIAPLLAIEGATAAALLYQGHRERPFLVGLGLMLLIWLSTLFLQAPLHVRLMGGRDPEVIRRLIRSNWLRTLAWTARGFLVASLLK